jgi:hypothetical protein
VSHKAESEALALFMLTRSVQKAAQLKKSLLPGVPRA